MVSRTILTALAEDPKRFLGRAHNIELKQKAKLERIAHWREAAENITVNMENPGAQGSGFPESRIEKCVVKIAELEAEMVEDLEELATIELETKQAIEELTDLDTYRFILELRFVDQKTYEEISVLMGYTFRWTQELVSRALEHVKEKAAAELRWEDIPEPTAD